MKVFGILLIVISLGAILLLGLFMADALLVLSGQPSVIVEGDFR